MGTEQQEDSHALCPRCRHEYGYHSPSDGSCGKECCNCNAGA